MKTLMFVEDDPILMNAYSKKFQKVENLKLLLARDGQQAIDLIDREQPDLMITGISMPKLDGFQVLEYIRAKGYTFPIIFLTNHESKDEIKAALSLGVKEYLIYREMTFTKLRIIVQKYLYPKIRKS